MFRQGLRRCARQAARSTVSLPRLPSTITASARSQNALQTRCTVFLQSSRLWSGRTYSTTAEASRQDPAETLNEDGSSQRLTNFSQLSSLNVHRNLVSNITGRMGYDSMTPVQAATIAPALKGTDIVAQAKTGTGKTIAFLLPMLQRMINDDPSLASRSASRSAQSDDIRGIVLSPTRELAEQIAVEAKRLVQGTGLVVQSAVGGTRKNEMLRRTQREGCHLLVATPGRLNDLLQDMGSGIDAPKLSALVLDEADRMLDVGFEKELNQILDCLPSPKSHVRQTMLVSATIPDDVIRLARSMVRPDDFEFIQTIPENESLTHDKVPQAVVPVSGWIGVFPSLFELIDRESRASHVAGGRPFKAIIYFNTTSMVQLAGEIGYVRRTNRMSSLPSYSIHSKLSQERRTRAAEAFRRAKSGVLYSSDVTARGMDFPDVTHVIQIGAPSDRESYIHRLGRTGRQGKEGRGYLILPETDVRQARSLLRGLPIEPEKDLAEPKAEFLEEELTKWQLEARESLTSVPGHMVREAYQSLFGRASDKVGVAEDLNEWLTTGLGKAKPPGVSSSWVHKLGLGKARGMNIETPSRLGGGGDRGDFEGSRDDRRFGRDRGGSFGRGRSEGGQRGGRFARRSSDPFSEMSGSVRRDGGGGGGGGRSRKSTW